MFRIDDKYEIMLFTLPHLSENYDTNFTILIILAFVRLDTLTKALHFKGRNFPVVKMSLNYNETT